MSGLKRAGLLLAMTVVLLAGCGGDDEAATGDDAAATNGSTSAPTVEPSPEVATEAGDSEFCAQIEEVDEAMSNLEAGPDLTDPEAALTAMDESLAAIRSVDPPAEIAEDWSTITSFFDSFTNGMSDALAQLEAGGDPASVGQELENLMADLEAQSAAMEEAGSRIDAYVLDECGLVLG
jgi:hypothetical protein